MLGHNFADPVANPPSAGLLRAIQAWDGLLEWLPIGIYTCDAEGLLVHFNRKAVELWGRTPAVGAKADRFFGADKAYQANGEALPVAPMEGLLRQGRAIRNRELMIERPDGTRIIVLSNLEPLRDSDGNIVGGVNCFQDITELRRAQDVARQREQWVKELLDALPAAIYTTDLTGRITYYNQAAITLWGRKPTTRDPGWCGSWRLYRPDGTPLPHSECPMARALKEGRAIRGEEAIAERPDGTRVPFIPYPTPLRDSSGTMIGAVNMLIDITDRKKFEQTLAETEIRLKLMAGELDHRARNLLATVLAIVRMTRAESVPEFVKSLTGRVHVLARAHTLMSDSRWRGADIARLVADELNAYGGELVRISGPALALSPSGAQALGMALHELATNAVKHGALSVPGGYVAVEWSQRDDGAVLVRWTEKGGPPVCPPTRTGFGSSLIKSSIEGRFATKVRFDWHPDGLVCEAVIPAGRLLGD